MEHPRLCGVKLHYSHYSHPIWIDPRLRGVKAQNMKRLRMSPLGTSVRGVGSPVVYIIPFDGINVNLPTIFERYARCTFGGDL